jgi:diguanylate cyclase
MKKCELTGEPDLKQWIQKLIDQINFDRTAGSSTTGPTLSEDRATILFIMETYNKHLLEVDGHPVRKVREILDEFAKELLDPARTDADKLLYRFRQFFAGYRIDEYSYLHKTFDEFRAIIWDFVEQLGQEISQEKSADHEMLQNLGELREAVEANSIDLLKSQSRKFIDAYVEHQTKKDERKTERLGSVKRSLDSARQQLLEANQSMRRDHLTQAHNRKSFDEQVRQQISLTNLTPTPTPMTLLTIDIDYFKRINDNFGHPVGDFVLKECVRVLHDIFHGSDEFVARIGGEEFAIVLPHTSLDEALAKSETLLKRARKDVFIHEGHKLSFTLSVGVALYEKGETGETWLKRADQALYRAKQTGRDRAVVAGDKVEVSNVA